MKKRKSIELKLNTEEMVKIVVTLLSSFVKLSPREIEVVTEVILNKNKEVKELQEYIAEKLSISVPNVSQQFTSLKYKKVVVKKGNSFVLSPFFDFPFNCNEFELSVKITNEGTV
ncbi:MAG TPA: hypothetical protein PKD00_00580 [Burkholderiales bacterium]|nr:hypothetical protein [Burkholderiales bacterium]